MIDMVEISLDNLRPCIEVGFDGDIGLGDNQPFQESLSTSIDRICQTIKNSSTVLNLTYFSVLYEGVCIGYTVIEKDERSLYSFAIHRNFRVASVLRMWFEAVDRIFDGIFSCVLYRCNERATKFLTRNGMRIAKVNDNLVTLIKNDVCQ